MNDRLALLRATLALYRDALSQSLALLWEQPWLALLVPGYTLALGAVGQLVAPLGLAGGLLSFLALAACSSSFLALVGERVARRRVSFADLGPSFAQHLGSVAGVLFVFWIIQLLLSLIVAQDPSLGTLELALNAGLFVIFNPLPELIYQGSRDGLALLEDAVEFLRENALEWLLPVAALLAPLFALDARTGLQAMAEIGAANALPWTAGAIAAWLPSLGGAAAASLGLLLASAGLLWIMLFRGLLFRALARSSRRRRVFEARMRGA